MADVEAVLTKLCAPRRSPRPCACSRNRRLANAHRRGSLKKRGAEGIRGLSRHFKIVDRDKSGSIVRPVARPKGFSERGPRPCQVRRWCSR